MNRKIKRAIELIAFFVFNRVGAIFLKLNNEKVVFASEARENLKGNLKAVYENMPENYEKVVWIKGDRRDSVEFKKTIALWKDFTTAKYIILDDFYGLISAMNVRTGQEIVQLWHGSGAFKKFGFSRIQTGDNIKNVHMGYRKYTKAIVTAEPIRWCFAEAFGIDIEKVQAVGSPRTDMFFDEKELKNASERVYKEYPKLKNKKVILIAPTYRGRKVEDACYDFEKLDIDNLIKEFGDEYQIVVKWHPALYNNIKRGLCKFDNASVIDASPYSDINDLLVIANILVTDYSSVVFDWYLLDKPVIYFTYDLEEYKSGRGLYFDFDEYVYGNVATNSNELVEAIRLENKCPNMRLTFNKKFMDACDGSSVEKVIAWILNK